MTDVAKFLADLQQQRDDLRLQLCLACKEPREIIQRGFLIRRSATFLTPRSEALYFRPFPL